MTTFQGKYKGSIDIKVPLKNYDQNIRNAINNECYKRICEYNYSNHRHFDNILRSEPNLANSNKNICFEVSSQYFKLISINDNMQIGTYDFRKISFVSVVDYIFPNYFSFIAKDESDARQFHLIEIDQQMSVQIKNVVDVLLKIGSCNFPEKTNPDEYFSIPAEKFEIHCKNIRNEPWFFGPISSSLSESLLDFDGDFLVRSSNSIPNQLILSCNYLNETRHIMLLEKSGLIKTKTKIFADLKDFINYHYQNEIPFVSESENMDSITLRNPIIRSSQTN